MITIDMTLPMQIINILILMMVLNVILYRPIRTMLAARKEKLAGLATDVQNYKKNAQLRVDEFDTKMNDARRKAKAEFDGARAVATAAGNEKLAEIRGEADKTKAEQLSVVASEFTAARKELTGQVDDFAKAMAGKILGRAV
ncbi:MAG: ATP synthase F0 subunit B [Desulfobulbaceae bacterium]|jgi:F-type H+-transporting ATPase subunit b|nr:ATP synthase F0 subunit B [Desulfobulbaceae bacterium]